MDKVQKPQTQVMDGLIANGIEIFILQEVTLKFLKPEYYNSNKFLRMEDYKPVNCDFYDELEALATLKKESEIVFRADNEAKSIIRGRILDLYTRDRVEYMKLNNGLEIRLDRIIEINGKKQKDYV
jgi:Rho-binding antiterminator